MKVLYFDCFSGISGDMTLGALIDLGIDKEIFINELNKLKLDGYRIKIEKKQKSGITVTDVDVILDSLESDAEHKHNHHNDHEEHSHLQHDHHHNHGHHNHEEHTRGHHDHSHESHSHDSRNLIDINNLIDESELSQNVKDFSKKVFMEIAKAEAKVHDKHINEVHFHEVGAIDSIVDIVGAAICLDLLHVDKVYSSPLHDGKGFIKCQHGIIPVPVPAVMEMFSGSNIPLISEDVNTEMVTPTGMGIIKCLASDFRDMPPIKIDKVGYGVGKRDTKRFNALRVVMGTFIGKDDFNKEIAVLETNIDDMSGEMLGYAMDKLMNNGALDVFYVPIYMKKNRPAFMLTVLADKKDEEKLIDIILRHTSTLGIRKTYCNRICMQRELVKIKTEHGDVRVKVASHGDIKKFSPEYEDCKDIADKTGLALSRIYDLVKKEMS